MIKVSSDYRRLDPAEVPALAAELADSWKDASIPMRQWVGVVRGELERYREGEPQPHFDVLIRALKSIPVRAYRPLPTLLDVGCSSGFYSEILRISGVSVDYVGLDYSEAYAELARQLFPGIVFRVGDARELPFADNSFDIVLSGNCLIHIYEAERVIAESARVARSYVVMNKTPVSSVETSYFEKVAYGVRCFEAHHLELDLFEMFSRHGLEVISAEDAYTDPESLYAQRTYLLKVMA